MKNRSSSVSMLNFRWGLKLHFVCQNDRNSFFYAEKNGRRSKLGSVLRQRSAFTVAAPSSLDNLVKDLKMNLTVSLWFTAGHLEGGRLSQLVDVRAGHGQGVCFFRLQGHSRWKNAWVNLRDFYMQKRFNFLLACSHSCVDTQGHANRRKGS